MLLLARRMREEDMTCVDCFMSNGEEIFVYSNYQSPVQILNSQREIEDGMRKLFSRVRSHLPESSLVPVSFEFRSMVVGPEPWDDSISRWHIDIPDPDPSMRIVTWADRMPTEFEMDDGGIRVPEPERMVVAPLSRRHRAPVFGKTMERKWFRMYLTERGQTMVDTRL